MLLINKTLWRLAKGLWGWIIAIALLKVAALAGTAAFAKVVSGFLGSLLSLESVTASDTKTAILFALLASLLMLCSELLTGEAEFRCTAKARIRLRAHVFSKILELDVGKVEKLGPVSAITSSVDGVEAMTVYYSKYLPGLIYSFLAPVYLFFQMKTASLPVAVMLLCVSFFLMPVNNLFRSHIEKLKRAYWDSMEDMTGYYLENIQGLTTIKLFGQDERRTEGLRTRAMDYNRKIMAVMRINFTSFLLTDGLIYGSVTAAVIIAGTQLLHGSITVAQALTVLMLSFGFYASVRVLMNATHSALAGVSAADKMERVLDMDTTRPYDPNLPGEDPAFDGIKLEHISFSYEGRAAALKDVSLTVPKGKVTALAGLSGCGKSTAAALMMRFNDVESGRILLEGKDYVSMKPEEIRKHVIMVPQFVTVFSGTVADNLRMAAPEATDEELYKALSDVRLKTWIDAQPDGLNTDVGDAGAKLSGGQRQKIGIARALLCRAEYIIFDEATSSVDVESEQEIWNCIRELALSRTLVIISHRLSSIRNADIIYVLEGGRIAQSGSHDKLIKEDGLYRRLVEEQAELERQGEVHLHG